MSTTPATETAPPSDTSAGPRGIAGLKPMSTTAGVGLGEYRAINPLTVASAVLAVFGLAGVLHPIFIILPALGVVLGLIGILQIRRSQGTQAGLPLGIAGIVGGLLIGGAFGISLLQDYRQTAIYRTEVRQAVTTLGEALQREDYEAAYAMTTPGFQERVPFEQFENIASTFSRATYRDGTPMFGPIIEARAGERIRITPDPVTGRDRAMVEFSLAFETGREDRQALELVHTSTGWRVDEFPTWFN